MSQKVVLFLDNSNVFIPAQSVSARLDGPLSSGQVRIQFDHLYQLARAGREVQDAVCVGSVPPELERVWRRLRATGITVELFERGAGSGKEQGVDQCLQVHMLRTAMDATEPGIAVLLTGDGAGYLDGIGFHADLERMHRSGWKIEVLSWDIACNRYLKQWAEDVGVYIPLESYYDSITFLEGTRQSRPVSLVGRPGL